MVFTVSETVNCLSQYLIIAHFSVLVVQSLQSCPTLCNPMDYSPPGSSSHRISQERLLEWVAISFSRGSSRSRDQTCISCIGRWTFFFFPLPLSHMGSPFLSDTCSKFCLFFYEPFSFSNSSVKIIYIFQIVYIVPSLYQ